MLDNLTWTDERIATLKRMHRAGLSFSQIGAKLGVSRNACIGKAGRLELPGRLQLRGPRKPRASRAKVKAEVKHTRVLRIVRAGFGNGMRVSSSVVSSEVRTFECIETPPLNKTLSDLGANDCKYITNDPRDGALYCGHPVSQRSYCADHFARCYFEPLKRWGVAA